MFTCTIMQKTVMKSACVVMISLLFISVLSACNGNHVAVQPTMGVPSQEAGGQTASEKKNDQEGTTPAQEDEDKSDAESMLILDDICSEIEGFSIGIEFIDMISEEMLRYIVSEKEDIIQSVYNDADLFGFSEKVESAYILRPFRIYDEMSSNGYSSMTYFPVVSKKEVLFLLTVYEDDAGGMSLSYESFLRQELSDLIGDNRNRRICQESGESGKPDFKFIDTESEHGSKPLVLISL